MDKVCSTDSPAVARARLCRFAIVAVMLFSQSAAAQHDNKAGARAAAERGLKAYAAENYEETIDFLRRAESLYHAPTHLLYLARAQKKLGKWVEAREYYIALDKESLSRSASDTFKKAQADGRAELDELEPLIPYLTVDVAGDSADVSVRIDGEKMPLALLRVAQPINPGRHELWTVERGVRGEQRKLSIEPRQKLRVRLSLPDRSKLPRKSAPKARARALTARSPDTVEDSGPTADAVPPPTTLGYVGLGVGAVGLGAGTFFLVRSISDQQKADSQFERCNPGCSAIERNSVVSLDRSAAQSKTMAVVAYAAGAGLGLAGVLALVVAESPEPNSKTSAFVRPWVSTGMAGLAGSF